jgi:hypothetical protein
MDIWATSVTPGSTDRFESVMHVAENEPLGRVSGAARRKKSLQGYKKVGFGFYLVAAPSPMYPVANNHAVFMLQRYEQSAHREHSQVVSSRSLSQCAAASF